MSHPNKQISSTAVHHLTWCLFSQPLASLNNTKNLHINHSTELQDWLCKLHRDPLHLLNYIQENNHRLLGSYFECLWQYYFIYGPYNQLLADHVQVSNGSQTLGELDILTKVKGEPMHVELAVKFYLQLPNTAGNKSHHWVGPQSHDRLDIKLDKLAAKQLPFLYNPNTIETLKQHNIDFNYQQVLALKGYLFHQYKQAYQLPDCCIDQPNIGSWLHQHQVDELLNPHETNVYWKIIPKHEWLGPYTVLNNEQLCSTASIQHDIHLHFNHSEKPYALMLIKLEATNVSEKKLGETFCYTESCRFLIVADHWPAKTKPG